jgi:hypothetical protein
VAELAITSLLFTILTMGMLDLGVGVFRFHIISQAARHVARRAMVHGELATSLGVWGPDAISTTMDAKGIPALDGTDGVQGKMVACDLSTSNLRIEWPSGNKFGDPVTVSVSTTYRPLLGFIFAGGSTRTMTAVSTVYVAH